MIDHAELLFWKKCPTCGYCEMYTEGLSDKMKELARSKPLTFRDLNHPAYADQYEKPE